MVDPTPSFKALAATTIFCIGSKYVSSRFELTDALIFSKDCQQSKDQHHLMPFANSLLNRDLTWRSKSRKLL